eukprot:TRINITY_DN880_c1_g3_i3.p1 TRINITY_DN880_c1_g3~~TRINITY_DN880_c1_g3_i3.p1  ORF type:complete len:120 (+),score=6.53 TRINITY_DN880_c1_g3_i3:292-651(+)
MASIHRSGAKKSNDSTRLIFSAIVGVTFGFLVGISFPNAFMTRLNLRPNFFSSIDMAIIDRHGSDRTSNYSPSVGSDETKSSQAHGSDDHSKVFIHILFSIALSSLIIPICLSFFLFIK